MKTSPKKTVTTLMIQGTTSDAGKTTLVAGLCRLFANKGVKVAPFKPQNMALNSAVTPCGGEIGRAQALQAKAAGLALDVDFNPILLKPNSDTGAQVIVHGKALTTVQSGNMEAVQYQDYKKIAMQAVLTSHQRLSEQCQLIIVEGAGSPAEINLREGDIANMGFAEAADCPVIIIADIDKGGVFAHLVGTLMLLSQSEQNRVIGFVINRFRGDIKLLESGLTWLEERTNKPVLGVLPYLHGLDISSEDALVTNQNANSSEATDKTNATSDCQSPKSKVRIIVLVYPHMSNHTDFDALRHHPDIDCQFLLAKGREIDEKRINAMSKVAIPPCDLVLLPGSKNVRSDLHFLREQCWHDDIARHLRYGGKIIGICGGYQMLGERIDDPLGVEGPPGSTKGLGYLGQRTILEAQKTLLNVSGQLLLCQEKTKINGYEIHAGKTLPIDKSAKVLSPLLEINHKGHGALSDDGQIAACYLHGLFDTPAALQLFITWLGYNSDLAPSIDELEELAINRICQASTDHLDINKIEELMTDWYK